MGIPRVKPSRLNGQTGVVRPGPTGILAIIASASSGTMNLATSWNQDTLAQQTFISGPAVDLGSYTLNETGNPVLIIRCNASTPGAYGTVQQLTNGGTSVASAGGTAPVAEFNVLINWVIGGTVGTAGAIYTYSLDGGDTTSGNIALGTANTIVLTYQANGAPTGVTIDLAVGTVASGGQIQFFTTRPQPNNADVVNALEALRITKQPWESLYVDVDATATIVSTVDTWLTALNKRGVFNEGFLNVAHKTLPISWNSTESGFASSSPAAPVQTENAYSTALSGWSTVSTVQCIIGADAAFVASLLTGTTITVPTAMVIAANAMSIPVGQDPAWIAAGPVNATIFDDNGNPYWHDENVYELLDSQRFSTLRTVDGEDGTYITNANCFTAPGSDYTFLPYLRVMNKAATVAFQELTQKLSMGVGKQKPDPITGAIYILEADAQAIEQSVNPGIMSALAGQVQDVQVALGRTDDLSSNAGATITATLEVEVLALIKGINFVMTFVKTIAVPTA